VVTRAQARIINRLAPANCHAFVKLLSSHSGQNTALLPHFYPTVAPGLGILPGSFWYTSGLTFQGPAASRMSTKVDISAGRSGRTMARITVESKVRHGQQLLSPLQHVALTLVRNRLDDAGPFFRSRLCQLAASAHTTSAHSSSVRSPKTVRCHKPWTPAQRATISVAVATMRRSAWTSAKPMPCSQAFLSARLSACRVNASSRSSGVRL